MSFVAAEAVNGRAVATRLRVCSQAAMAALIAGALGLSAHAATAEPAPKASARTAGKSQAKVAAPTPPPAAEPEVIDPAMADYRLDLTCVRTLRYFARHVPQFQTYVQTPAPGTVAFDDLERHALVLMDRAYTRGNAMGRSDAQVKADYAAVNDPAQMLEKMRDNWPIFVSVCIGSAGQSAG